MAQSFNTSLAQVAIALAQQLRIPVTATSLKNRIEEDPYYPSLYSLSATYDKFGIENAAYEVSTEKLDELQPPFIAYMNHRPGGKDFVLVTALNSENILFTADGRKTEALSREAFIEQWENIIFSAVPSADSGEKNYLQIRKQEQKQTKRKSMLAVTAICALLLGIATVINLGSPALYLYFFPVLLLKLLGTAAAVILLVYDIDKENSWVKSICTAGKQTNCDAVLHSSAAKVVGISWSEAGFFYFAATTLFLLFPGINYTAKALWLVPAAIGASAYIPFSIYYQWRIVKQWCPLCLSVQAVLLGELCWAATHLYNGLYSSSAWTWAPISAGIFCFAIPILAWYILKPILHNAKEMPLYRAAYKRLLYTPGIFSSLLQEQAPAPDGYQHIGITLGNPDAANTIIKVCNPYCGPCAGVHPVLHNLVAHNPDVNIKLIFTATPSEKDKRSAPVKHLLAIAAMGDAAITAKATDDWYLAAEKDYTAFATKYPMNGELKQQDEKIEEMTRWCDAAEITYTPTLFINGHRLPETYSADELQNFF
ncbi:vitamin K epoxide reductase family protein [Chitinophagaceae bacterium MMS25-I14]